MAGELPRALSNGVGMSPVGLACGHESAAVAVAEAAGLGTKRREVDRPTGAAGFTERVVLRFGRSVQPGRR